MSLEKKCKLNCAECEECSLLEQDMAFPEKTYKRRNRRKKTAKWKKRVQKRLIYLDREAADMKSVCQDKYESCREKKIYKKFANHKLRHSKNIPLKGNGYRKNFEVQWEID